MSISLQLNRLKTRFRTLYNKVWDPRRIAEEAGKRVAFDYLQATGFLEGLEGKRILEVGPKHGEDSQLLATLRPHELVLLDLPEKRIMIEQWYPKLSCNKTYVEGNLLYLTQEERTQLGQFDLVWCLGVLYHNVEQLRLIKRLYDFCNPNGKVVIESATTRNKRLQNLNIVEIHWPNTYRSTSTITHLPSRLAIKSWLEMTGFTDVMIRDAYSKQLSAHRAIVTGIKRPESRGHQYYGDEMNPIYIVGEAT